MRFHRIPVRVALLAVLTTSALLFSSAQAFGAASPWWNMEMGSRPGYLPSNPGEEAELYVFAENVGDAALDAEETALTIKDTLPPGLTAVGVSGSSPLSEGVVEPYEPLACSLPQLSCAFHGSLPPYDSIEMRIRVVVQPGANSGEENQAIVSGGNAPLKTVSRPLVFSGEPAPFGLEDFRLHYEEEGGAEDIQAGSHPFQFTTTVVLNQGQDEAPLENPKHQATVQPVGMAKQAHTKFPLGFAGNPTTLPTCSLALFLTTELSQGSHTQNLEGNKCPDNTIIGAVSTTVYEPQTVGYITTDQPLYNLEPTLGEPARFGFIVTPGLAPVPVVLDASLRSGPDESAVPGGPGEDYGIDVNASAITQIAGLIAVRVTTWGTPGDPRHDNSRGWGCLFEARGVLPGRHTPCLRSTQEDPPALITLPTSCSAPMQASQEVSSWAEPGVFDALLPIDPLPTLEGCNRLAFSPSIVAGPSTQDASAPSGLDFNLNFHDEGFLNGKGLAQSQLKNTVVKLPEGFTINPSAGVGLKGCTPADFARETLGTTPGAGCPDESKLGTVEITTPLLTTPIHGSLYIATPYDNSFPEPGAGHPNGTLVALYIVAKNPVTGILLKLSGKVVPNPVTGQLTTIFENNPQLPFDHFNFHFREGQQAPLISPPLCGTYTTYAQLTPWSEPETSVTASSSFTITKGYDGGACPPGGAPPFKPGILSGTINNNAGAFTPFYLHLTRTDGEQEISGFSTNLPDGLTGDLTGVPFCPEADIEAARHKTGAQEEASPSCPAASQIGHTLVGTGVGAVLAYVPGKIYLAGPFHGAPFSIVSVTSAVVGPFDLGTVVLRFGLAIDPNTARVNVTPTSSEPIPTIIDGIVTHVRDIRVYIDRSNFILGPTSCNPMSIGSTLNTPSGVRASVTSPFQNSNCQALKFEPKFAVSTSGKTSRTQGASLHVKLTYPTGALGKDTNIAKVKVDLPRQLPSRLTTLQKACTETQFESNPAGCPAESRVGQAKAVTPLIPEPLEGPAYFVSHGGAKFPELIIVLQGYGVTIDLHGETFINKEGITSSTFASVPDQPIGSFELTLPEGKYSALAANGNLCAPTKTVTVKKKVTVTRKGHKQTVTRKVKQTVAGSLVMPTAFMAQNGVEIHQNTPITVTSCGKTKAKKAKKARAGKKG